MADTTIDYFDAAEMVPDEDAQLVAGDNPADRLVVVGRPVLAFDDTDEEAAVFPERLFETAGGTLNCAIDWFAASDTTNDVRWEVYVEAKTPNADTLDIEAASGWDSANAVSDSASGSTAGDPLRTATFALTNKDSIADGDIYRIGIRRDTDYAAGDNDDLVGDAYLIGVRVFESS